ncbi:transposase InsO family protein [Labrenzia sp. EL_142]|nr:transposase InsO family protein [Labrenzia sp. EL_142]
MSERRACEAMGFGRASHRYRSRRDPEVELRMRLKDLADSRVRYGYRRLHILLKREGWHVNHKHLYRLYCEEGPVDPHQKPQTPSGMPLSSRSRDLFDSGGCDGPRRERTEWQQ